MRRWCRARALCVPPLGPPLVPCRRCRSLVGRGFGQRRSVLPQRVFTPRIGVCCFSLHRFYRHQHRRLYFTVLHLSFTSVGVCTSAVCTRPMTERTLGSTARNDERLHVSLAGRSLFGYAPVGWVFVHRQMCGRSNVPRTGQVRDKMNARDTVPPPPAPPPGPTRRRAPEGRTAASRPRGERSTLGIRSPPAKTRTRAAIRTLFYRASSPDLKKVTGSLLSIS